MPKIRLKKAPKVFFDASINLKDGLLGIGIYELHSKLSHKVSYPNHINNSIAAETLALKEAVLWANNTFAAQTIFYLTDCESVYDTQPYKDTYYKLTWIPRELNKEADYLSKQASSLYKIPVTNLAQKLQQYPFDVKLKLLKAVALTREENLLITALEHKQRFVYKKSTRPDKFIRFCNSILLSAEKPKLLKAILGKQGISDPEVESLLRTRVPKDLK